MKSKALKRAVIIVLAFAMLVSSVCLPSFAEDINEEPTAEMTPDEKLKAMMMANRFVFSLPKDDTDLLDTPVQFKGVFSSLTNQTRMQVVYNEGGRIDALDTAYLSYKITNNSSEVLSIGTMVYFRTTGGNLCAYVLKPLVYDAKTGKKLDLTSSYEYTSGKFVLTDVMPTVEIPANSEVFMAVPFVSVNDQTNYIPGLIADGESYAKGTEPSGGCLWSNNSERTVLMEEKLNRDGNTDCLQMQIFLGGNGTDANGVRRYGGNFHCRRGQKMNI